MLALSERCFQELKSGWNRWKKQATFERAIGNAILSDYISSDS